MTTFEDRMAARDPGRYADFLLPHLDADTHLLDLGCGDGALTVGLAATAGRADESADDDWVAAAVEAGLATDGEMAAMARAWTVWGESPASYAAFTWCRAVARKPEPDEEGRA